MEMSSLNEDINFDRFKFMNIILVANNSVGNGTIWISYGIWFNIVHFSWKKTKTPRWWFLFQLKWESEKKNVERRIKPRLRWTQKTVFMEKTNDGRWSGGTHTLRLYNIVFTAAVPIFIQWLLTAHEQCCCFVFFSSFFFVWIDFFFVPSTVHICMHVFFSYTKLLLVKWKVFFS